MICDRKLSVRLLTHFKTVTLNLEIFTEIMLNLNINFKILSHNFCLRILAKIKYMKGFYIKSVLF